MRLALPRFVALAAVHTVVDDDLMTTLILDARSAPAIPAARVMFPKIIHGIDMHGHSSSPRLEAAHADSPKIARVSGQRQERTATSGT